MSNWQHTDWSGFGRVWGALAIYLALVACLGSVVGWLLAYLVDYPFVKVVSRSILLVAALGLIPLYRLSGLTPHMAGWERSQGSIAATLISSFLLGVLIILPVFLFLFVTGHRVWDPVVDWLSMSFLAGALVMLTTAWLAGTFEEVLFRGVLFGALRRYGSFWLTAVTTSLLYAAVHFLNPGDVDVEQSVVGGFSLLGIAFSGMFDRGGWDAWLPLFMLGLLFAWVREQFSLWACIAMHSAWVFSIRIYKELTVRDDAHPYTIWVSDYDRIVGELVCIWLLFCFIVLTLRAQHLNLGPLGSGPKKERDTT